MSSEKSLELALGAWETLIFCRELALKVWKGCDCRELALEVWKGCDCREQALEVWKGCDCRELALGA